jgi:hypothetical protein
MFDMTEFYINQSSKTIFIENGRGGAAALFFPRECCDLSYQRVLNVIFSRSEFFII